MTVCTARLSYPFLQESRANQRSLRSFYPILHPFLGMILVQLIVWLKCVAHALEPLGLSKTFVIPTNIFFVFKRIDVYIYIYIYVRF